MFWLISPVPSVVAGGVPAVAAEVAFGGILANTPGTEFFKSSISLGNPPEVAPLPLMKAVSFCSASWRALLNSSCSCRLSRWEVNCCRFLPEAFSICRFTASIWAWV